MHAVVVKVTMNDVEAVMDALPKKVVPMVSSIPGFITGYWTTKENDGLGVFVFESEEIAVETEGYVRLYGEDLPSMVTLDGVEVRSIVAHSTGPWVDDGRSFDDDEAAA